MNLFLKQFLSGILPGFIGVTVVAAVLVCLMAGARVFGTSTFGDVYQISRVQNLDGDVRFEVECARWYHPGFAHRKWFFVNTTTPEAVALENARAYKALLKVNKCVASTTTTINGK